MTPLLTLITSALLSVQSVTGTCTSTDTIDVTPWETFTCEMPLTPAGAS